MEGLCKDDLDRISEVIKVRRGIYVMQLVEYPNVFRFGAIGTKENSMNNGIRRLGQIDHGKTICRYVKLFRFKDNYSHISVKGHEDKLKIEFKKIEKFQWIGGQDRFKVVDVVDSAAAEKLVAEVFDYFVASNFT
jgi:hypothetical protein